MTMFTDVQEFMNVAGQTVRTKPTNNITLDEHQLRIRLIAEEADELFEAMMKSDLHGIADGVIDLMYVVLGAGAVYGLDIDEMWKIVQAANMAKFPDCPDCDGPHPEEEDPCDTCDGKGRIVLRDRGGKVMKPDGWQPPDLSPLLQ